MMCLRCVIVRWLYIRTITTIYLEYEKDLIEEAVFEGTKFGESAVAAQGRIEYSHINSLFFQTERAFFKQ